VTIGRGTRRGVEGDAEAIADVFLASFRATYAFPMVHSDDAVRRWVRDVLVRRDETWVAEADGAVVGFLTLTDDMLDQLYVAPAWQGRGIGADLVALAKQRRPDGLDLYTFQVNARARAFYERRGFRAVAFGDGSGNEEQQPDVRYAWRP
jgi:ribosomal protein S18 acetylase RimI-like enzyme